MKYNEGITLTSVVIYVIVMLIVVGTVGTITGFFYSSTQNLEKSANSLGEFNKFNTYFLNEVKLKGNAIERIDENRIVFTSGTTFALVDGALYKDMVKICTSVKACQFDTYNQEEKTIIRVYLEIGNDFAKTIEYVMDYETIGSVGQYEENYTEVEQEEGIPIYNLEQLLKIASGESLSINGKVYTLSEDKTYVIKNNIEFEYEGIWKIPTLTKTGSISCENQAKIIFTDTTTGDEYYYSCENNFEFALYEKNFKLAIQETPNQKWDLELYTRPSSITSTGIITKDTLVGLTPYKELTVPDSELVNMNTYLPGDYFLVKGTTYIYCENATTITTTVKSDDGGSTYLNDTLVVQHATCADTAITLNFKKGWNKLEVLFNEHTGSAYFKFGVTLSSQEGITKMQSK